MLATVFPTPPKAPLPTSGGGLWEVCGPPEPTGWGGGPSPQWKKQGCVRRDDLHGKRGVKLARG